MPLTGPDITAAIIAAGAAPFPGSQNLPKIAQAVGTSIPAWLSTPSSVVSLGVTAGLAGGGTAAGKLSFIPGGQIPVALQSAGLLGPTAQGVGSAVETGLATVLNTSAQYLGVSTGVAQGTDTTKVSISNGATLLPILLSNLQASGINGQLSSQLANGLSIGISGLFLTGFGFGGVVGAPGIFPSSGSSVSRVM